MRKIMIWGLLVCLGVFAISTVVSALEPPQSGTVTSVNDAAKTFTSKWKTRESTYKTSAETAYSMAGRKATWSDLKVGDEINVTYHLNGKGRVADKVEITGYQPIRAS